MPADGMIAAAEIGPRRVQIW